LELCAVLPDTSKNATGSAERRKSPGREERCFGKLKMTSGMTKTCERLSKNRHNSRFLGQLTTLSGVEESSCE